MPEIICRAATADDAGGLASLRWQMEAERTDDILPLDEYVAVYEAETRDELARGVHRAWLAEVEGKPVACVLLIWWVMPPNFDNPRRKRGFVSSVYTLPEYRRQAIARRLMEALVEHARAEGVQRLILWSSDSGRPLYESLGFVPSRALELNL